MHNSTKFNINGNPTDDEAVISNSFNNYFIHVGLRLAQQIQSHINPLNYGNDTMKSMFIPYISEYEITETVKSLKNSSAGWDFFPASIAKQCLKHYIKPLTYPINSSFESGTFPEELKLAIKLSQILKAGINKTYQIIDQYQYYHSFLKFLGTHV